jgi:hypothetical protein
MVGCFFLLKKKIIKVGGKGKIEGGMRKKNRGELAPPVSLGWAGKIRYL